MKDALEDVKLIARGKWCLVKPVPKASKVTKSGLVRPDNDEDEQKAVGTVLSVGTDIKGIKAGDKVLYGVFAGERVETIEKGAKVNYVLLMDDDIVAFVK
jgi:co-chaperonin GroES (HSP10)